MDIDVSKIPKILKNLDIWLCYDDRDKDYHKNMTSDAINNDKKRPRDIYGNYCNYKKGYSLKECLDSIKKGVNSGIGISLNESGLIVIDYDNCIKGYKKDDKFGLEIPILADADRDRINRDLNILNSYTEISPSGKGLHIYILANKNIKININKPNIEIYTNQFIRFSGNRFNDILYTDVEDRTDAIEQILNLYNIELSNRDIGKKNVMHKSLTAYQSQLESKFRDKGVLTTNSFSNKEIKDTMFASKKGDLLKKLYYNTITDAEFKRLKTKKDTEIDTSDSGKAITLIMHLLYYAYGDLDAVYKIFKSSALCKDKYLIKNYRGHREDIIQNQFIPFAVREFCIYDVKDR